MTAIGHRTGLFDIMNDLPPSPSCKIAETANLNERYVREWMGAMVVSGIVEYSSENDTYALPAEHGAWLTRKAASNNMAVIAQFISVLGSVEVHIVECFRKGGGAPYSQFKRFHQVMKVNLR